MSIRLGELATRFGLKLVGDPDAVIERVASLSSASGDSLSFLASKAYTRELANTKAAAVILREGDADGAPTSVLISDDPYAAYARAAAVIHPAPALEPGIHESAIVAPTANVDPAAQIDAGSVVGDDVQIAADVHVGPRCYVGPGCSLGVGTRLVAGVTLVRDTSVGERCVLQPGVVVGADGFGNAMTAEGWIKVPQVGGVRIGDDVEIGANSTIDCGALGDTIIEDGVRIDNLCMIAHNVHIGAHTAMAAMTGIAGSTRIGRRCMFAGKSGAVGHVTICDDVIVSGKCMISKNITEPGVYASSFPQEPVREWNRMVARLRRLGRLFDRVARLEKS